MIIDFPAYKYRFFPKKQTFGQKFRFRSARTGRFVKFRRGRWLKLEISFKSRAALNRYLASLITPKRKRTPATKYWSTADVELEALHKEYDDDKRTLQHGANFNHFSGFIFNTKYKFLRFMFDKRHIPVTRKVKRYILFLIVEGSHTSPIIALNGIILKSFEKPRTVKFMMKYLASWPADPRRRVKIMGTSRYMVKLESIIQKIFMESHYSTGERRKVFFRKMVCVKFLYK